MNASNPSTRSRWAARQMLRIKRLVRPRSRVRTTRQVLRSQWLKEDRLRALQWGEVKKLLDHAYRTTRYYRELLDAQGVRPRDIRTLSDYAQIVPPLDRSTIKARLEDLISSEWRDRYVLDHTSGSTGTPMTFAHPKPFPLQRASRAQLWDFLGYQGHERFLRLWGSPLQEGRYFQRIEGRNEAIYSFYDLPPEGLEELVQFILDWRPEVIGGYVSALCVVADALEQRGLEPSGIRVVWTSAEMLYSYQRARIARVFGAEVFNHYGSREISDYGVECHEHHGVHLFSNLRLYELEPASTEQAQTGELLVTDFANYAMPLIRYRNGDVLSIERGRCPCGRSLPRATLHGRSCDMLRLRDGSILDPATLEALMHPERIARFLYHQRSYDRLDVHIVPTQRFTPAYRDALTEQIRARSRIQEVVLFVEDEIDVEIAGKYRLLRSDLSTAAPQR